MKTVILLIALIVGSANAQVVYQTREYHEPYLPNIRPNPFPPSFWDSLNRKKTKPTPRVIISTQVQTVIPTGQVSPQDQQIINLIK